MPEDTPSYDDETLKQFGLLAAKVASNPKTKKAWRRAVQEVNPSASFALEADDVDALVNARLEDERLKREQDEVKTRLERQKAELAGRYTPEEIIAIEAVMTKHGLSDYDVAARLYAHDNPGPVTPIPTGARQGERWTLPDDKVLFQDPAQWAKEQAYSVIDQMRGTTGRR